jgi:acyl-CoA thioesterase
MSLHHRSAAPGRWTGEVVFEKGAATGEGIVHGGFLASILDIAMGYASLTLLGAEDSQRTLELSIHFLKGAPLDRAMVEAEVLRHGRRTAYCEGSVRACDGTLVTRASATFAIRRQR